MCGRKAETILLVARVLARVDVSFAAFLGVYSGLAMGAICRDESDVLKRKSLFT